MMFSHGYYSVISPEGAGAIEGKIREGEKMPKQLVEACAKWLRITASDNLKNSAPSTGWWMNRCSARKGMISPFSKGSSSR